MLDVDVVRLALLPIATKVKPINSEILAYSAGQPFNRPAFQPASLSAGQPFNRPALQPFGRPA